MQGEGEKMGAGHGEDHHVQDAAEAYLVWRLQECAEQSGLALEPDADQKRAAFDSYVDSRNAREHFDRSEYKANVDAVVAEVFRELAGGRPGERFAFVDVEKEYRDLKRKGDLEIRIAAAAPISVSVKNYKKGFRRIQLCSGTWNSFLNNFLFESAGVGSFLDPRNGEVFRGSDRPRRNELVEYLSMASLAEVYDFIDAVNDEVRAYYVYSPDAETWNDVVAQRWERDCAHYGAAAAERMVQALSSVSEEAVKARLLVMAGLNYEEEILLLGQGRYLCSLFSRPYRDLLSRVNDPGSKVVTMAKGQSLKFTVLDVTGVEILDITVPFTLQKNGAWHLPREPYHGVQFHPKERVNLRYGQRRPKKSKELATSTNTYLDLGKLGLA